MSQRSSLSLTTIDRTFDGHKRSEGHWSHSGATPFINPEQSAWYQLYNREAVKQRKRSKPKSKAKPVPIEVEDHGSNPEDDEVQAA